MKMNEPLRSPKFLCETCKTNFQNKSLNDLQTSGCFQ